MKDGIKRSFLLRHRITSVFLALVFLSLSAIQIFHSHSGHGDHDLAHLENKSHFEVSAKCDICDYFFHHHGKVIHTFTPVVLSVALPAGITVNTPVCTGMCSIALPGFSNKGPPSFA